MQISRIKFQGCCFCHWIRCDLWSGSISTKFDGLACSKDANSSRGLTLQWSPQTRLVHRSLLGHHCLCQEPRWTNQHIPLLQRWNNFKSFKYFCHQSLKYFLVPRLGSTGQDELLHVPGPHGHHRLLSIPSKVSETRRKMFESLNGKDDSWLTLDRLLIYSWFTLD